MDIFCFECKTSWWAKSSPLRFSSVKHQLNWTKILISRWFQRFCSCFQSFLGWLTHFRGGFSQVPCLHLQGVQREANGSREEAVAVAVCGELFLDLSQKAFWEVLRKTRRLKRHRSFCLLNRWWRSSRPGRSGRWSLATELIIGKDSELWLLLGDDHGVDDDSQICVFYYIYYVCMCWCWITVCFLMMFHEHWNVLVCVAYNHQDNDVVCELLLLAMFFFRWKSFKVSVLAPPPKWMEDRKNQREWWTDRWKIHLEYLFMVGGAAKFPIFWSLEWQACHCLYCARKLLSFASTAPKSWISNSSANMHSIHSSSHCLNHFRNQPLKLFFSCCFSSGLAAASGPWRLRRISVSPAGSSSPSPSPVRSFLLCPSLTSRSTAAAGPARRNATCMCTRNGSGWLTRHLELEV